MARPGEEDATAKAAIDAALDAGRNPPPAPEQQKQKPELKALAQQNIAAARRQGRLSDH
jgi:hypothetical protein